MVSQPKKLKQERYKFHSNQNYLAQKNLTLSRQDHYGIPLVIGYKRKLMCLPYERVIFGLTGSITMYCNTTVCADSWRSSFTLKVVLVRLSFGYPLLIVTSQDSLSIQHWWWRNSGRKEESGRMKKKIFLSCVKNGCEMRENGGIFRIICELKEAFSSNSSTLYAVLSTIKIINLFTVFENQLKIYHSTLRANVHILSGQKLIKNAKKVHLGDIWKSEACGQWVLPDISLSKKTNIGKNIKIDKFNTVELKNQTTTVKVCRLKKFRFKFFARKKAQCIA